MKEENKERLLTVASVIIGLVSLFRDIFNFGSTPSQLSIFLAQNTWLVIIVNAICCLWIGYFIAKKRFKKDMLVPTVQNSRGVELVKTIDNIIDNIHDDTRTSFEGLFRGWLTQLNSEINAGGNQIFDIDSNYYANCLIEIETEDVYAIADLTSPIENFWLENTKPIGTQVKERIFLIEWKDFFNESRLEKYIQMFKINKQLYDIRIGHVPLKYDNGLHNFPNKVGCDLFIGKPNLVGGYIFNKGRTLLRMVRNERTYLEAKAKYKFFKDHSFEFNTSWNIRELKKQWLKHNKIGYWSSDWDAVVEERTPDYFINYDMHIRSWIPRYDEFILGCFDIVRHHTVQLFRSENHRLKILEIGFGTGALAKHILDWLHQFDKPLEGTSNAIYYYGIDPAKDEMFAHSHYDINAADKKKHFFTGAAFDEMDGLKAMAPFDIICSSLVLHDLNSDNPNPNFTRQLKKFSSLLRENGRVIIADLFGTTNRQNNNERFKYWKLFLNSNLSEDATTIFLESNKDMINCIKEEHVKTLAEENGFQTEFKNVKKGDRNLPFKYLILTKK